MKERPVIFSGSMIRAILDGKKTQTRRVVKLPSQKMEYTPWQHPEYGLIPAWSDARGGLNVYCPYGKPGDSLWVRETWFWNGDILIPKEQRTRYDAEGIDQVYYRADGSPECDGETVEKEGGGWTPSIHMPRWASRITLEICSVRVERLKDISAEDAIAEGLDYRQSTPDYPIGCTTPNYKWYYGFPEPCGDGEIMCYAESHTEKFAEIWDSINGNKPGCTWQDNPWVWVLSIRRVTP